MDRVGEGRDLAEDLNDLDSDNESEEEGICTLKIWMMTRRFL